MKSDKLQDAIGNIREEYIEEAHADIPAEIRVESIKTAQVNAAKHHRRVLRTALPLAACLLVAVGLALGGKFGKKGDNAPKEESYSDPSVSEHPIYYNKPDASKADRTEKDSYGASEIEAAESGQTLFDLLWRDYCISMDTYMEEAPEDYPDSEGLQLLSPEEAWKQMAAQNEVFSDGLPDDLASAVQSSWEMPSVFELKYLRFDGGSPFEPYYVFWRNPKDIALDRVSPEFLIVPARSTVDSAN